MPTYNGWEVITMPGTPPAPASVEFEVVDIAAMNISPFNNKQQVYDWNASFMRATVHLPPLSDSEAQEWISFLRNLKGVVNVFQFTAAFCNAYPASLTSESPAQDRYWRLAANARGWSLTEARTYGITFECVEAM